MDIVGYKEKELQYYVLGNIIVMIASSKQFQSFVTNVGQEEALLSLLKMIAGVSVFGVLMYIYTFLISSLISGETKIKFAYFKVGKPAGFTIFTNLRKDPKDMRILRDEVLQMYHEIYDNMPNDKKKCELYENNKWYDIYHKYRDMSIIKASNREFLVFRDMTIMTIPVIVGYIGIALLGYVYFYWFIVGFFVLELIATNVAMRKKCERLVKNVIAIDLREK